MVSTRRRSDASQRVYQSGNKVEVVRGDGISVGTLLYHTPGIAKSYDAPNHWMISFEGNPKAEDVSERVLGRILETGSPITVVGAAPAAAAAAAAAAPEDNNDASIKEATATAAPAPPSPARVPKTSKSIKGNKARATSSKKSRNRSSSPKVQHQVAATPAPAATTIANQQQQHQDDSDETSKSSTSRSSATTPRAAAVVSPSSSVVVTAAGSTKAEIGAMKAVVPNTNQQRRHATKPVPVKVAKSLKFECRNKTATTAAASAVVVRAPSSSSSRRATTRAATRSDANVELFQGIETVVLPKRPPRKKQPVEDPNVTKVTMNTGILYIYKNSVPHRVEFVRTR